MAALADLVPTWLDLGGCLGVFGTGLVFLLCGRALLGGRGLPELQLFAGWGAFSLVLTLWGVVTMRNMAWPAFLFIALALAALIVPGWRPRRAEWLALGRIMLLSLPIWAIMLAVRPSLPDTFTNFLPNAVYLFDHGYFPADSRPASFSVWPAFPYNLQLATFLASLPLPQFPTGAPVQFNILLQLIAGLLLARLLRAPEATLEAAPCWAACAGGLLLATGLNPGFVPRIDFTGYAEPGLSVGLAFVGFAVTRALGRLAEGLPTGGDFRLLALLLAALIGIKQVGIVLAAGTVFGFLVLALADRRIAKQPALRAIVAASLPGLILYGGWRAYLFDHFVSGELKLLPESQWRFDILPLTVRSILQQIAEKPIYFAAVAVVCGLAVLLTRRRGLTSTTRLLLLSVILFAVYNLFLLLIYVVHMGPVIGAEAHSYFRYMTHLDLLLMLGLASAGRDWWMARRPLAQQPYRRHVIARATIVLMLLAPTAFSKRLRFDAQEPGPLVRALAGDAAGVVKDGDRLALLLPGDNGSVALMLASILRFAPPRRAVELLDVTRIGGLDAALAQGYRQALLSCDPTSGKAELLAYDDTHWRVVESWTYPALRDERWTTILSAGPFCRR